MLRRHSVHRIRNATHRGPSKPHSRRPAVVVIAALGLLAPAGMVAAADNEAEPPSSQFEVVNGTIRAAAASPEGAASTEAVLWGNSSYATTEIAGSGRVILSGRSSDCEGWAVVAVSVDGVPSGRVTLDDARPDGSVAVGPSLGDGLHDVRIDLVNDNYVEGQCDRNAYLSAAAMEVAGAVTRPSPTPVGRPGSSNTGVPAGTKLTVHDGDLTISRAGTVVDGLDVRGDISVKADNVTIRNTIVRGRPVDTVKKSLISAYGDHKNLLIEDTTLRAAYPHPNRDGLKGRNFTARRINVSNVVDAVLVFGDNVRLEDSWLHDNTHFDPDWISTDGKSHDDSLQIQGGNNITIRHNVLEGAFHTGIMITQDRYRSTNITIAGNWLSGGSCTLNIAEKARGPITGLTIRDNRFGTSRITNCPIIAPPTTTQIATITNNLWDTTNTPITIRRGS